ncbi:MAG: OmpA family protein [Exilibacterium sp.]
MRANFMVAGSYIIFSLASPSTYAQEHTAGFTLSPQLGYYAFDSKRNLSDEVFSGVGVGYRYNNHWGVELNYLQTEADIDNSRLELDFDQYRLDALYHFSGDSRHHPYLVSGIGDGYFENSFADDKETQFNFGGGIKYFLTDMLAVRSDARVFYGADDDTWDYALTLSLFMQFGPKTSRPEPKTQSPQTAQPLPVDSDSDGVEDNRDNCPNTPANVKVNSSGCIPDSDGDGIADNQDNCPDSSAGAKVDEQGCYIVLTQTKTIELNIQFPNNSDEISPSYSGEIAKIAEFMREYPQTTVAVEGHTDDRGDAQYNQQLSERRAKAVAKALVNDFNIDSDRVIAIGKGEAEPIASNNPNEGRKANRRVVGVVSASVQTRAQ